MATEIDTSFLSGANAPFIAELYARYLDNPGLVDDSWRGHFDSLQDEIDTIRAEGSGPSWARHRTRVLGQSADEGGAAPRPAGRRPSGRARVRLQVQASAQQITPRAAMGTSQ